MDTILTVLDKAMGPIFGIGFFGFMIWLFYWLIVVVPKKIGAFFKEMGKSGYRPVDLEESEMLEAMNRLVPPHPQRTSGGSNVTPWKVRKAIRKDEPEVRSYITMVNRNESHAGDGASKSYVQSCLLFFQERALEMDGLIYLTPKKNRSANKWQEYFGAEEFIEGYGEQLHQNYHIFSPEKRAIPIPAQLEKELIESCEILCRRELFCFANGVNLQFSADGWGICPDNYAYKKQHLQLLTDLFHRIDHALSVR
ncbi:MAG: hypothetical protein D6B25_11735 [Desulfobulbaceae bacterium]|nr:MAG: hypothetical protein D6B25_11735 [Desulfobulbaceae bacterium]